MNIYSNVEKENTSKKIMLVIVSLLITVAAYAYWSASQLAPPPPVVQSSMSEVERIKEEIRKKKFLKDQAAEAGREAAEAGDFNKSTDMAEKVGNLADEIKILYDKLHEANLREGDNGEEKN